MALGDRRPIARIGQLPNDYGTHSSVRFFHERSFDSSLAMTSRITASGPHSPVAARGDSVSNLDRTRSAAGGEAIDPSLAISFQAPHFARLGVLWVTQPWRVLSARGAQSTATDLAHL